MNSDTVTDAQFSPKQGQSITEATKSALNNQKNIEKSSKKALEDLNQKTLNLLKQRMDNPES